MLRELVVRDWILNRRSLLPVAAIFSAFQVYLVLQVSSPRVWIVFTSIYVAFLTVTPVTRDDKFRAAAWWCTLPVSRTDLVRARYVVVWGLAATGLLLALLIGALVPSSTVASAVVPVNPDVLLLAAAIVSLILTFVLPFTIRFGFLGLVIGLAALQVLAAITFVVAKLTEEQDRVEGTIGSVFQPIIHGVGTARESLGPAGFSIAAVLTLLAVNWIAYRLTLALFKRREL